MPSFSHTVDSDFKGSERLDKYIASQQTGMNRSKLKNGVTSVLVNGKKAKLSAKVTAGDKIDIEWEETVPANITPQEIPLNIVYEDDDVTVVNKKQGMVTHPAAGNWDGTLVNALLFHWGRESIPQENDGETSETLAARRPGIVHRLDKDTSGLIITAKNRNAEDFLYAQFKNHRALSKEYICICSGHPPVKQGIIRTNITRDQHDRKKFRPMSVEDSGKYAVSMFRCISCYGPYSLMKIKIFTGRTHQIRVHLKFIGCPILGDPIYSKSTKGTIFEGASLMLHAYKLRINLPSDAQPDKEHSHLFTAPVPVRFKKVIKTLHEKFQKSMPPEKASTAYAGPVPTVTMTSGKILQSFEGRRGYGQWQK